MLDILTIARQELVRRVRDRSAFVLGLAAPVGLAVVFGFMLSGADGGGGGSIEVGLVGLDPAVVAEGGPSSEDPSGDGDSIVEYVAYDSEAAARAAVDDSEVGGAVVVRDLASGDLLVLTRSDRPVSSAVAEAVAGGIRRGVAGSDAAPTLVPAELGGRDVSLAAYYGASMPMLFLFFTTSLAAQSLLAEREGGTLARLLSGPTSVRSIVLGKVLALFALSVVGFAAAWLITTVLSGARWGAPPGVLAVIVASVAALSGIATFVASFARTSRQAEAAASVVAFVLALLGGSLIAPGAMPDRLRQLRRLTPNGWALDGFVQLSTEAATVGSILVVVVVLLVFAVVFGAVGLARLEKTVVA